MTFYFTLACAVMGLLITYWLLWDIKKSKGYRDTPVNLSEWRTDREENLRLIALYYPKSDRFQRTGNGK